KADADLSKILIELTELIERLKHEKEKNDEKIAFNIKTGTRLLTIDRKHEIEKIVDNYPNFLVHRIVSDVINIKEALQIMDSKNVHVNGDVSSNGKVKA